MVNIVRSQKIQCDWCQSWTEMPVDRDHSSAFFNIINFKHPDHWFIFSQETTTNLCSWDCVDSYVQSKRK